MVQHSEVHDPFLSLHLTTDHLVPDIPVQTYLKSVRSLKSFRDFMKMKATSMLGIHSCGCVIYSGLCRLSHQREPDERSKQNLHLHPLRASKSTEDLMTPLKPEVTGPVLAPLSPQYNRHKFKRSIQSSSVIERTTRTLDPPSIEVGGSPDLPGRKVVTLPADCRDLVARNNGKAVGESMKAASPATRRGHMKSRSLGTK